MKVRIGESVPMAWAGLDWYAVQFAHAQDREARRMMEAAGVPVFLLEGRELRRVARGKGARRPVLTLPMAGYGFVADLDGLRMLMARERLLGRDCPVLGVLGNPEPVAINGAAMQLLFAMHEAGSLVRCGFEGESVQLHPGDPVRICVGPFASLRGIVDAVKRSDHAEILTELLGRQQRVRVPLDSLERV